MIEYTIHNVLSGTCPEPPPSTCMILQIDATIGGTRRVLEFAYREEDPYGLSPLVREWLIAHPEFTAEPFSP